MWPKSAGGFSKAQTRWLNLPLLYARHRVFLFLSFSVFQALLSMGFPRQEYWSVWPFPPPGDLPHPGIEPLSLMSPALAGGLFTASANWEAPFK